MRFGHLSYLALFALIPLLISLLFWSRWRKRKVWEKFADSSLKNRLLPTYSSGRSRLKTILKLVALCFLILALIEPQWGMREEEVQMRGINIMLLVDVSDSMLSTDIKPNRLERERRKLRDLLRILAGDRVGLIAFAGRSFLLSPLTIDYTTLDRYIDGLNIDTIPVKGTDLAGALQLALKSFPEGKEGKAIILLTDGEDHSQKMKEILEKLKQEKVKLFVLGIGTPEGAPVPEVGGGFKSNREGKTVVSKLGEKFLQDLALKTGGAYARTVASDEDLKELYLKGIRGAMDPEDLRVSTKKVWESRFYWPLGIALFLLALERLIPEARRKNRQ